MFTMSLSYYKSSDNLDCCQSKMSRQYGRQPPRNLDVKSRTRTMNKFVVLDPDVASNYEDLDDQESSSSYRYRGGGSRQQSQRSGGRGSQLFPKKMLSIIDNQLNRKDTSVIRSTTTGTQRRDLISQITVRNASRSGKDHILKLLAENIDQFLPIAPKLDENGDMLFYVLNEDDASAVAAMSKRIADKHNLSMKYTIYKTRKPAPFDPLNNASRQVIEQILKSRYNQITNSLDLSNFQNDPSFEKNRETPRGLFHNHVMVAVANYVSKNFCQIQGIRLNNNSLRALDFVSTLVYAAPNVVELDLSNNAISRIEELNKLSGWKLERVHFENNEFTIQFSDNFSAYTNAVHEQFPFVNYLDGVQVNTAPGATTSSSAFVAIPKFKPGFHTDDSVRNMIETFLVEYYTFYDGLNGEQTRQQLINAYDPNATFSYCICTLPDAQFVDRGDQENYQQYMRNSHNIINQQKWQSFRDRLIFRGPMDIAVALSKLPPTEHVKQSFLLDFNLISNNLVVGTLQGVLRDGKDNIGAETRLCIYKFFVRQFVIIPKSEGLAILSDMIQLTPINAKRMENYNNLLKNATTQVAQRQLVDGMAPPPPSPQQINESAFSSGFIKQEPSTSQQNEQTMHRNMVKEFCLFSGMKPEWSEKCLQDCSWNWSDAQKAFASIKNQIPPEAFGQI